MKKNILASLILMFSHAPSLAVECVTNPRQFDFVKTSAQIFYFGSEPDVRGIYGKLKNDLNEAGLPNETTIYYAKGRFQEIVKYACDENKCTGMDVLSGLQECSSGPSGPDNVCYPLAAVYNGSIYCMLAPGLDNYGAEKPFKNFNPYGGSQ